MNGFNDKELQRIWDLLGLPADVSKQEEFERMVYEWRNAEMEPKRIVLCMDCFHVDPDNWSETPEHGWCDKFDHLTNSFGFCAWGEQKGAE